MSCRHVWLASRGLLSYQMRGHAMPLSKTNTGSSGCVRCANRQSNHALCVEASTSEEQSASLHSLISALSAASAQQLDVGLHVVPTPIGNREDITLRALRVLGRVSTVYAEDTRHTGNLLSYYGIKTSLRSLHEHNEYSRIKEVVLQLERGAALALVADAGMPSISDPGSQLVAAVVAAGQRVIPLPGPSAAVTALVASGLPSDNFRFVGFLPPKGGARRKCLQLLEGDTATLVCYVPPHALAAVLKDTVDVLGGQRMCCVARELTKSHEELVRGTLQQCAGKYAACTTKGEITLVIQGKHEARCEVTKEVMQAELQRQLASGLSPSSAAKAAAAQLHVSKGILYDISVKLAQE